MPADVRLVTVKAGIETPTDAFDSVVRAAATNQSGTIAVSGTAQAWLAANPARRGFTIQNQSAADLYIRIGGTAAINNTSLRISAGQLYETPQHHVSTNTVSIIGANAGQAWYGTEF